MLLREIIRITLHGRLSNLPTFPLFPNVPGVLGILIPDLILDVFLLVHEFGLTHNLFVEDG